MTIFKMAISERQKKWHRPKIGLSSPDFVMAVVHFVSFICSKKLKTLNLQMPAFPYKVQSHCFQQQIVAELKDQNLPNLKAKSLSPTRLNNF